MDLGNKNLDKIAELACQMRAVASAAYFNPIGNGSAKRNIESKVKEITELLKDLPE